MMKDGNYLYKKSTALRHSPFNIRYSTFVVLALLLLALPKLAPATPVNINSASSAELTQLPFIGEARAAAIINHRRQHGPFASPSDLVAVNGIGERSLTALTPLISVGPSKKNGVEAEAQESLSMGHGQIMVLADDDYFPTLLRFIRGARSSIEMTMFLFKRGTRPANRPRQLAAELVKARQRGVRVRLVLDNSDWNEGVSRDNKKTARYLRRHGVEVRLDSPSTTNHTKMVIIDDRFSFVGSHNMTNSALSRNHEMSLLLDNPRLARQLQTYIKNIH
ncbi:MAG: phospholipase D-like domain-containing protein [Thermodesulfobacteriota bacterium]